MSAERGWIIEPQPNPNSVVHVILNHGRSHTWSSK